MQGLIHIPGTEKKVGAGFGKMFGYRFADPFAGTSDDYIHKRIFK
jgi:hypothetical protein